MGVKYGMGKKRHTGAVFELFTSPQASAASLQKAAAETRWVTVCKPVNGFPVLQGSHLWSCFSWSCTCRAAGPDLAQFLTLLSLTI